MVSLLYWEKEKDKQIADALLKACEGQKVSIETVEQREKTEKPPKLYDLTTLQREANRLLGFTAEQTLEYTQSLYEKKLVTYPRTDSRFLTEDMQNSTSAVVNATAEFFSVTNPSISMEQVTDNSKVTDHHAIIPTINIQSCDIHFLPLGEREILLLIALFDMCRGQKLPLWGNNGNSKM